MSDERIVLGEPKGIRILKKTQRIINIVLCVIISPILLVSATMFVKKIVAPNKIPDFFGYKFFVVLTGSMEDTLMPRDFIIVKEVKDIDLKEGDIITFVSGSSEVTHRIIEKSEYQGKIQYATKGDNNNAPDDNKITIQDIQGKFVTRIAGVGRVLMFLQTTMGIVILVLIPVLVSLITLRVDNYTAQKQVIRKNKRLKYEEEKDESKKVEGKEE